MILALLLLVLPVAATLSNYIDDFDTDEYWAHVNHTFYKSLDDYGAKWTERITRASTEEMTQQQRDECMRRMRTPPYLFEGDGWLVQTLESDYRYVWPDESPVAGDLVGLLPWYDNPLAVAIRPPEMSIWVPEPQCDVPPRVFACNGHGCAITDPCVIEWENDPATYWMEQPSRAVDVPSWVDPHRLKDIGRPCDTCGYVRFSQDVSALLEASANAMGHALNIDSVMMNRVGERGSMF
jgi:hypothetical protein